MRIITAVFSSAHFLSVSAQGQSSFQPNFVQASSIPYSSTIDHAFPANMNDPSVTYSTTHDNKSSVYSGNLAVPIRSDNFVQATSTIPPLNNSTSPNQYPVQISQSPQLLTSDIYPKMYTSDDQNGAYRMMRWSE